MIYYHVSSQLQMGEIIYPEQKLFSGWSKCAFNANIQNYADFERVYNHLKDSSIEHDTGRTFIKWLCETLFESIRRQQYPVCPTRIYGTFLCKNLSESRKFNEEYREGKGTIFLVEAKKTVDYFDMQLFTDAEESLYSGINEVIYKHCVEKAKKYWGSKNDESIIQKEYICMENLLLKEIVD